MEEQDHSPSPQQLNVLLGIYEEMVESAHDGMLLVEANTIIGCNPAACALYGLSRSELIGSHPASLSPEFQPDGASSASKADHHMNLAFQGMPQRFLWQHLRRNAAPFCAEVTLNPARLTDLPERGKKPRFVAIIRDVTQEQNNAAVLEQLNNELEQRVEQRTAELQTALDNLRIAQEDLIRSEKLAGLGALVAGIAHELNTPIGNAVMVASSLQLMEKELRRSLQEGLKRSAFEQFLGELQESTDIIDRNLRRAAELISSFKQVAVDQSSYQRRPFNLADVLHELRLTMTPTLRKTGVLFQETSDAGLLMDSYPGPLTQVLMNIVNNAVMHAFEHTTDKQILITASRSGAQHILLTIRDNGCGIDPSHQSRIFDPFFTTKLGQGGSGLGLHIVYTLVTGLLGGRISLHSQLNQGTQFELLLPLTAPAPGHSSDSRNTV